MKTIYTKLILEDGVVVPARAGFTGRHELVRIEHPMLAKPIEVAAYALPALPHGKAMEQADKHTVYDLPMRGPEVEEAFFFVDRSRPYSELKEYFPDIEEGWSTWTRTPYVNNPSGDAWLVGLRNGDCVWYVRGYRNHVRAVRAGQ